MTKVNIVQSLKWLEKFERLLAKKFFKMVPYAWVLCLLLGALGVHVSEYSIRAGQFEKWFSIETFFSLEPLRVLFGVMLFYGFRRAPTYLRAWAVFIFFIVLSRLVINVTLGETLNQLVFSGLVAVGFGLILISQVRNVRWLMILGLSLAFLIVSLGSPHFSVMFSGLYDLLDWWVVWLAGAALIFEVQSWLTRKGKYNNYFGKYLAIVFLPNYVAGIGLFYGYQAAPTFMFGWAIYNLFDVVFRAINNQLFIKEPFLKIHALGMILITSGTFALNAGASH